MGPATTTGITEDGAVRMVINGKWLRLGDEFVKSHPGGPVLLQYKYSKPFGFDHEYMNGRDHEFSNHPAEIGLVSFFWKYLDHRFHE